MGSLIRAGETSRAAQIRRETLAQLAEQLHEYFEPFTGEPLGSHEQSWTAAVALDMLAVESKSYTEEPGRSTPTRVHATLYELVERMLRLHEKLRGRARADDDGH